ncbi:MAG: ammonium transporter [Alphaproteobacteria bacterium]|nr:ammonium transporter [Alphaproteobacteria bacterium]
MRAIPLTSLFRALAFFALPLLLGVSGLRAEDVVAAEAPPAPTLDTGDTAWMIVATALVLMMAIPGVALFYGGMVRKKNVLSIAMQSFAITCVVTVLWFVCGYSLAFTPGGALFGSLDKAFLMGVRPDSLFGTVPETVFICFQLTLAIITVALITGAVAERMKFGPLLIFSSVWLLAVYVPIAHMVWGGGFLGGAGVLDFAGGTVVHISSGVAGLVAALILGRRIGYRRENMQPHNLVLSLIGASLLWVGWFGFNAGSAVGSNGLAGLAMLVTQIAAAMGALAWMAGEWAHRGKPSVLGAISGAVAGLVAITPASGFVGPAAALAIGATGGFVCYLATNGIKRRLGYDDSLDVFGVHGIGGIAGAVLTGVFATAGFGGKSGAVDGEGGQILTQLYGIAVTVAWSGGVTALVLFGLKATIGIRVDEESEREGLDIRAHGESVA